MMDDRLDDLLKRTLSRTARVTPSDEAAAARVMTRLAGPLPRQKRPLWRLPAVLLDWQFAPAWPRMAALACSALLGFYIGIAGLDRSFDQLGQTTVASSSDNGFYVFDPEPLSGARP